MAIMRWRPFGEIDSLRSEMDRLFENFYRSFYGDQERVFGDYPLVDIKEDKNELIVTAEVPGMTKDDIKISITDNVLTIKGEKKEEKKEEDENYHRAERRYGAFQRSFTLEAPIDTSKVKATCKDGILTIRLPKKEESKMKEIPISVQ